jgi:hypothetical protein
MCAPLKPCYVTTAICRRTTEEWEKSKIGPGSGGRGDLEGTPCLKENPPAMGVADGPNLANLYGYYYERKACVLEHPNIFYYGHYIDNCIAIVYAESNLEAINLLQSLIQFDNCVIEWSPVSSSQPFLDMLLYKNNKGELHYMPYHKAGNHQERTPWISAHPLDIKRGTFLGEMS